MDNGDLIRGLSSPTIQIFGISLIVLILALNADGLWIARPLALVAAIVMLVIGANWIAHALTRSQADQRRHGHR
jgi:uncharacterized membrane protein